MRTHIRSYSAKETLENANHTYETPINGLMSRCRIMNVNCGSSLVSRLVSHVALALPPLETGITDRSCRGPVLTPGTTGHYSPEMDTVIVLLTLKQMRYIYCVEIHLSHLGRFLCLISQSCLPLFRRYHSMHLISNKNKVIDRPTCPHPHFHQPIRPSVHMNGRLSIKKKIIKLESDFVPKQPLSAIVGEHFDMWNYLC